MKTEKALLTPEPKKTHISSAAFSTSNPAGFIAILDVFPHFIFSVCYSDDSKGPPPDCLLVLNPIPH